MYQTGTGSAITCRRVIHEVLLMRRLQSLTKPPKMLPYAGKLVDMHWRTDVQHMRARHHENTLSPTICPVRQNRSAWGVRVGAGLCGGTCGYIQLSAKYVSKRMGLSDPAQRVPASGPRPRLPPLLLLPPRDAGLLLANSQAQSASCMFFLAKWMHPIITIGSDTTQ